MTLTTETFSLAVIVVGVLLIPSIALSYLFFRLHARHEQLRCLFTLPGILKPYLSSKGQDTKPKPGESDEHHWGRLRSEFEKIFIQEFNQEYHVFAFLFAIFIATVVSALVGVFLFRQMTGNSILPLDNAPTVGFALLGAYFFTLLTLVRGYTIIDIVPSTFYWVTLRYIFALVVGVLASYLFSTSSIANIGAFILSSMPTREAVAFIRSKIQVPSQFSEKPPSLTYVQGMHDANIERLSELGIHTAQELAYFDPLVLLFRTNFSPKIVLDWMDQAVLVSYVGEAIKTLRHRGFRGVSFPRNFVFHG